MSSLGKPVLCVDFDGVIHSYTSGWQGAAVIPDPPVAGALAFLREAGEHFMVAIYSSRSHQPGGIEAMKAWLWDNEADDRRDWLSQIAWPTEKPPAFLSIDDRALTFDGTWPTIEALRAFKPWNKR